MKIFLYTALALLAFAGNSILCRLALRGDEADAAGFTAVRLFSGAVALAILVLVSKGTGRVSASGRRGGSWLSAIYLFTYAICFSLAYLNLTAGTGALILFGSVQMTMIVVSLFRGTRPSLLEWVGLIVAVAGLVYLVFPTLASPPLNSSLLMAAAGAAWGFYTLRGKGSTDPLRDTAGNFVRTLPFAAITAIIFFPDLHLTTRGATLAIISGAITSGVGYAIWYAALKHLTSTRAAVLQLAVPIIAATIGIVFLDETASNTLFIAAALILGGIALTIFGKK